jgi:hypothetical protein
VFVSAFAETPKISDKNVSPHLEFHANAWSAANHGVRGCSSCSAAAARAHDLVASYRAGSPEKNKRVVFRSSALVNKAETLLLVASFRERERLESARGRARHRVERRGAEHGAPADDADANAPFDDQQVHAGGRAHRARAPVHCARRDTRRVRDERARLLARLQAQTPGAFARHHQRRRAFLVVGNESDERFAAHQREPRRGRFVRAILPGRVAGGDPAATCAHRHAPRRSPTARHDDRRRARLEVTGPESESCLKFFSFCSSEKSGTVGFKPNVAPQGKRARARVTR